MEASEILIAKVKEFEGLRLYAYRDSGDKATIGYGHTKGVRMGQAITRKQAEEWLLEDLAPCCRRVESLGLDLTQGAFDALADFVFNLGWTSLTGSTLLRRIRAGAAKEEIQAQFRRWVYCKGKVLQGLARRREWEAQRYFE